jgi:hypothetical protein
VRALSACQLGIRLEERIDLAIDRARTFGREPEALRQYGIDVQSGTRSLFVRSVFSTAARCESIEFT